MKHTSAWAPICANCYQLQDPELFTLESARGKGVARALIEAVARAAREHQSARYYWLTQDHNTVARALYRQGRPQPGLHPLARRL